MQAAISTRQMPRRWTFRALTHSARRGLNWRSLKCAGGQAQILAALQWTAAARQLRTAGGLPTESRASRPSWRTPTDNWETQRCSGRSPSRFANWIFGFSSNSILIGKHSRLAGERLDCFRFDSCVVGMKMNHAPANNRCHGAAAKCEAVKRRVTAFRFWLRGIERPG